MNQPRFLAVVFLHHTCAQMLVIPNNMLYRDNPHYAEVVLLLQGATFVCLTIQQYSFTLDIRKRWDLFQMKISVTFVVVTVLWSRVIRYAWLSSALLSTYYADGSVAFKLALLPVVCMSLFNLLLTVDTSAKFNKFIKLPLWTCTATSTMTPTSRILVRRLSKDRILKVQ